MKSKKRKYITAFAVLLAAGYGIGCITRKEVPSDYRGKSPEAIALIDKLKYLSSKGCMFGHHDDTIYGIGWDGDSARSDVKSVCGDYPAIISFDLGHIEINDFCSLDSVAFDKIRNEALRQHGRGGIVSFSWHLRNPKTGGDSWDVSDSAVVASILSGGANNEKFKLWLMRLGTFLNSITTGSGEKIPVLFRPWHEHTGAWFWWGADYCTPNEYKELWKMTVASLQEQGADQLLYVYSPGGGYKDSTEYLERYPGDEFIDLLGFDTYQFDHQEYIVEMDRNLSVLNIVGEAHDKITAITETGFEAIPDSVWWTQTLLPLMRKHPVAYVLVWRNAREKENHYYAPYPGQSSENDFIRFYQDTLTLFASEVNTLYSNSVN